MEQDLEDVLASVDYGYLCDLATARDWKLGLERFDALRFRLTVSDRERGYLAGVKFPTSARIDKAADILFAALREAGEV